LLDESLAGVLILGGGEATRLPGKLELGAGALPMLARVFANLSPGRETWLAGKGSLAPALDAFLSAPLTVDRWSLRGPLAGLVTTMAQMRARWVFAVAGDAPLVEGSFIDRLIAERRPGDEALVPIHDRDGKRQPEPLAALYDRLAFLREAFPIVRRGGAALRQVLDRLQTRYVEIDDPRIFTNVNTPEDYAALRALIGDAGR
jgi:molybdopterin-guanine dinucleotide biosynthesis protein A